MTVPVPHPRLTQRSTIDQNIAAETSTLEQAELPDPLPAPAQRRNAVRSRMFSLRLGEDEVAELDRLAASRGLPARTLARTWLLDRLHTEQQPTAEHDLAARVDRLEQAVFTH